MMQVVVRLASQDSDTVYASTTFTVKDADWTQHKATLESNGTDSKAQLEIMMEDAGSMLLDQVSLFPAENAREEGNPWPFRKDLVEMMRYLEPKWGTLPMASLA